MNDTIIKDLLETIADITGEVKGAYNLRSNGCGVERRSSENIKITPKEDKPGIDINVKPNTKGEMVHIPVVITEDNINDLVYNDFYIGENADVTIVAGCGIHNDGCGKSEHDGIHTFYIGKNAKVKYIERHYGEGDGNGENIMNPETIVHLEEGASMEMETTQIKGIDSTVRKTSGDLKDNASLEIREKIMTHGKQYAKTDFDVDLNGKGCSANVVSRSVARDQSRQEFFSTINGNNECKGHSECDAIIMDGASVSASPKLTANNIDANLIHEAAIGKIAGEQLIKLMTLGLTEAEAEEQIINGFLK